MTRPYGSAEELERRRRLAVERVRQGERPSVVARILGVRRSSLYRWRQAAQQGTDGLAAKPHPGPTPRLNDDQWHELEGLLLQGAEAHGWPSRLWTGRRVAQLVRRHFGLDFHPDHLRRALQQRLGWSCQKPQVRARERNDPEIERWRADEFPRIVREA